MGKDEEQRLTVGIRGTGLSGSVMGKHQPISFFNSEAKHLKEKIRFGRKLHERRAGSGAGDNETKAGRRIWERGMSDSHFVHIQSRKMTPELPWRGTSTRVTPLGCALPPGPASALSASAGPPPPPQLHHHPTGLFAEAAGISPGAK